MGSCIGSFHTRIPVSLGSWPADHQGRHHAGCRGGYSRRLGQDLVVAQSVTAIRAAEMISQQTEYPKSLRGLPIVQYCLQDPTVRRQTTCDNCAPVTTILAALFDRGFFLITISTSRSSALRKCISRSTENPSNR